MTRFNGTTSTKSSKTLSSNASMGRRSVLPKRTTEFSKIAKPTNRVSRGSAVLSSTARNTLSGLNVRVSKSLKTKSVRFQGVAETSVDQSSKGLSDINDKNDDASKENKNSHISDDFVFEADPDALASILNNDGIDHKQLIKAQNEAAAKEGQSADEFLLVEGRPSLCRRVPINRASSILPDGRPSLLSGRISTGPQRVSRPSVTGRPSINRMSSTFGRSLIQNSLYSLIEKRYSQRHQNSEMNPPPSRTSMITSTHRKNANGAKPVGVSPTKKANINGQASQPRRVLSVKKQPNPQSAVRLVAPAAHPILGSPALRVRASSRRTPGKYNFGTEFEASPKMKNEVVTALSFEDDENQSPNIPKTLKWKEDDSKPRKSISRLRPPSQTSRQSTQFKKPDNTKCSIPRYTANKSRLPPRNSDRYSFIRKPAPKSKKVTEVEAHFVPANLVEGDKLVHPKTLNADKIQANTLKQMSHPNKQSQDTVLVCSPQTLNEPRNLQSPSLTEGRSEAEHKRPADTSKLTDVKTQNQCRTAKAKQKASKLPSLSMRQSKTSIDVDTLLNMMHKKLASIKRRSVQAEFSSVVKSVEMTLASVAENPGQSDEVDQKKSDDAEHEPAVVLKEKILQKATPETKKPAEPKKSWHEVLDNEGSPTWKELLKKEANATTNHQKASTAQAKISEQDTTPKVHKLPTSGATHIEGKLRKLQIQKGLQHGTQADITATQERIRNLFKSEISAPSKSKPIFAVNKFFDSIAPSDITSPSKAVKSTDQFSHKGLVNTPEQSATTDTGAGIVDHENGAGPQRTNYFANPRYTKENTCPTSKGISSTVSPMASTQADNDIPTLMQWTEKTPKPSQASSLNCVAESSRSCSIAMTAGTDNWKQGVSAVSKTSVHWVEKTPAPGKKNDTMERYDSITSQRKESEFVGQKNIKPPTMANGEWGRVRKTTGSVSSPQEKMSNFKTMDPEKSSWGNEENVGHPAGLSTCTPEDVHLKSVILKNSPNTIKPKSADAVVWDKKNENAEDKLSSGRINLRSNAKQSESPISVKEKVPVTQVTKPRKQVSPKIVEPRFSNAISPPILRNCNRQSAILKPASGNHVTFSLAGKEAHREPKLTGDYFGTSEHAAILSSPAFQETRPSEDYLDFSNLDGTIDVTLSSPKPITEGFLTRSHASPFSPQLKVDPSIICADSTTPFSSPKLKESNFDIKDLDLSCLESLEIVSVETKKDSTTSSQTPPKLFTRNFNTATSDAPSLVSEQYCMAAGKAVAEPLDHAEKNSTGYQKWNSIEVSHMGNLEQDSGRLLPENIKETSCNRDLAKRDDDVILKSGRRALHDPVGGKEETSCSPMRELSSNMFDYRSENEAKIPLKRDNVQTFALHKEPFSSVAYEDFGPYSSLAPLKRSEGNLSVQEMSPKLPSSSDINKAIDSFHHFPKTSDHTTRPSPKLQAMRNADSSSDVNVTMKSMSSLPVNRDAMKLVYSTAGDRSSIITPENSHLSSKQLLSSHETSRQKAEPSIPVPIYTTPCKVSRKMVTPTPIKSMPDSCSITKPTPQKQGLNSTKQFGPTGPKSLSATIIAPKPIMPPPPQTPAAFRLLRQRQQESFSPTPKKFFRRSPFKSPSRGGVKKTPRKRVRFLATSPSIKSLSSKRFAEALLDEEVALFTCRRLWSPGTPGKQKPQRISHNPIGRALLDGDDTHFIPISPIAEIKKPLKTGVTVGSAFSAFNQ